MLFHNQSDVARDTWSNWQENVHKGEERLKINNFICRNFWIVWIIEDSMTQTIKY